MTREDHQRAIWIVGSRKVGNRSLLVMLCSGPDCGGAEMLARPNAADVAAEANRHIDLMIDLGGEQPADIEANQNPATTEGDL